MRFSSEGDDAYNFVVIGAGPGGLVAAAGAAGLGAKVCVAVLHSRIRMML